MELTIFPTIGSIAQKNILYATTNMTVRSVCNLMNQHGVSSVIIEKGSDRYIFSIEDLLKYIYEGNDPLKAKLGEISISKIPCVLESEHLLSAMEFIENNGGRYLGVTNCHNELIGIATHSDILSAIDPTILIEKKTIGELLLRTTPITFSSDWILEDVVFHLNKIEDSIIVIESGKPVGIITTRDVFKTIASGQKTNRPLKEYMSSPVITINLACTIHDALLQLKSFHIKRIIIVNDDNELVGIVTQSELIGFAYGTWINLIKHHACELRELVAILEEKAKEFEKSSLTDPLTGLGNRRVLYKNINEAIEKIRLYDSTIFSLMIIDIDFFKNINDNYGHLIGDEILRSISKKFLAFSRKTDYVARWGGEEFAILLPNTLLAEASEFANRLREAIENHTFVKDIKLTISIGVGQYHSFESDNDLFERVDKALYRAKSQGRNSVEIDNSAHLQN